MYDIQVTKDVKKYLKSIPKKMREHFKGELLSLEDSPRDKGLLMKGEFKGLYRMKLFYNGAHYRAIYEVNDTSITVLVIFVDKREHVYERAKHKILARA